MKYALIRMHSTRTMSANCRLLERSDVAASIASAARRGSALHLVLHGDSCGFGITSQPRAPAAGASRSERNFSGLRLLQRFDRLRDELSGAFENALRRGIVPGLGA